MDKRPSLGDLYRGGMRVFQRTWLVVFLINLIPALFYLALQGVMMLQMGDLENHGDPYGMLIRLYSILIPGQFLLMLLTLYFEIATSHLMLQAGRGESLNFSKPFSVALRSFFLYFLFVLLIAVALFVALFVVLLFFGLIAGLAMGLSGTEGMGPGASMFTGIIVFLIMVLAAPLFASVYLMMGYRFADGRLDALGQSFQKTFKNLAFPYGVILPVFFGYYVVLFGVMIVAMASLMMSGGMGMPSDPSMGGPFAMMQNMGAGFIIAILVLSVVGMIVQIFIKAAGSINYSGMTDEQSSTEDQY